MYNEKHTIDSKLACLCTAVGRHHPAGHEEIYSRFRIERMACGQDQTALTAMHERWLALEVEAQAEADRQARDLFERNFRAQMEEARRASVAQWRERQPVHGAIRTLREAIDDAATMRGVNDDADLLDLFDGLDAALKAAATFIGSERREARLRVAAAKAAAAVETFAPPAADDAEAA